MKVRLRGFIRILLLIVIIMITFNSEVFATTKDDSNEVNKESINDFMNEFFEGNMKKYSVPGVSVVVVKDGKEIFKKGYGYSDLEKNISVNPDKTVFPACSVSKLFTATAIMQLLEDGKIDLNENVENYIAPYKIENNYKKVVTCANLLTHSSGIDEASELNVNTRSENDIKSQEYYFDNHKSIVVREPDTVSRYSNQGYNILGYIIEKVSGISYEEYIKENILKPLKMEDTLVRLKNENTAKGYEFIENNFKEVPLAYQHTSGSSGINATATDMEKFMIAYLNNGEYEGAKILSKITVDEMEKKQFSNDKILPGMGYGFIRSNRNGQEIIKHEGGLPGFTTTMFLMPKEKLGIYVATNSLNPLPFNIEDEFLNRFYPADNDKFNKITPNKEKNYSKYEGNYRSYDGLAKSKITKAAFLLDSTLELNITDNKDGTLALKEYTSAKEENITRLVEIEEGRFAREDGNGDFAFRVEDGKAIYAFNDTSHNAFERIKIYEGRMFNTCLISITIIIFIINIITTLIKIKLNDGYKEIKRSRIINFTTSICNIIGFIGAYIMTFIMIVLNDFSFAYVLYFCLGLIIISAILNVLGAINLGNILCKRIGRKMEIFNFIIMTFSNIIFLWLMYYLNFLGFKF